MTSTPMTACAADRALVTGRRPSRLFGQRGEAP